MEEIVKLFKEDLLKGVQSLLLIARDSKSVSEKKASISIGLLFLLSVVLAVIRSLYAPAGIGIAQHFVSTFAILLSFYLLIGTIMLWRHFALSKINKYAATVFTCLLATGISYFVSILLFRFFTVSLLDWVDDYILPASIRDTWTVLTLEDLVPAILFSALGCWIALGNANLHRNLIVRSFVYFIFTTGIFYFSVFERGGFFDNVTKLLGGITLKSAPHSEAGAVLLNLFIG